MRIGIGLGLGFLQAPAGAGGPPPEPNPNLLLWSEEFQQAAWVPTNLTVTADQEEAPLEGGLTADLLTPGSISGRILQTSPESPVGGAFYTLSVYVMAAPGNGGGDCRVTLSDGVGSSSFAAAVSGAWTRFSVTRQLNALATTLDAQISPDIDDGTAIYAWGTKLEVGAVATAYVKREGT